MKESQEKYYRDNYKYKYKDSRMKKTDKHKYVKPKSNKDEIIRISR